MEKNNSLLISLENRLDCLQEELSLLNQEISEVLPKTDFSIKGIIVFKFSKCGKEKCICRNGVDLHGPYPHLQWYNAKTKRTKSKYLNRKIYPDIANKFINNKKYKELKNKKNKLDKEIYELETNIKLIRENN